MREELYPSHPRSDTNERSQQKNLQNNEQKDCLSVKVEPEVSKKDEKRGKSGKTWREESKVTAHFTSTGRRCSKVVSREREKNPKRSHEYRQNLYRKRTRRG